MDRDESYHQSAIEYNDGLAEAAQKLSESVEHPVIKKWCRGIVNLHRFHAKRHRAALAKMQGLDAEEFDSSPASEPIEDAPIDEAVRIDGPIEGIFSATKKGS